MVSWGSRLWNLHREDVLFSFLHSAAVKHGAQQQQLTEKLESEVNAQFRIKVYPVFPILSVFMIYFWSAGIGMTPGRGGGGESALPLWKQGWHFREAMSSVSESIMSRAYMATVSSLFRHRKPSDDRDGEWRQGEAICLALKLCLTIWSESSHAWLGFFQVTVTMSKS